MEKGFKKEIEDYVDDWHWDEDSRHYAFEMGKFLFAFMNYLENQNLSKRTKKSYYDNVYFIGMFEAGYGYNEDFFPEILEDGPDYVHEFERKISDSIHAVRSYESTWIKLDEFIKSGDYKEYLSRIEEKLKEEG